MFFTEDHLRVTKTKTVDGINPQYDEQNRPVKKVVHLPLTAKKFIESQNEKLPTQIKMDVQVIKAYDPEKNQMKKINLNYCKNCGGTRPKPKK